MLWLGRRRRLRRVGEGQTEGGDAHHAVTGGGGLHGRTQALGRHQGVGVGVPAPYYAGGYAYGPPVCTYGYYGYAPYQCAPYGYYGPGYGYGSGDGYYDNPGYYYDDGPRVYQRRVYRNYDAW